MTTPGLYRHKGHCYRVLFVIPWWGGKTTTVTLKPDDPVHVCMSGDERSDEIGARVAEAGNLTILTAKWSGNGETTLRYLDTNIVIYVALYGDGRIAARTEKEFEEGIKETGGRRFERIGD